MYARFKHPPAQSPRVGCYFWLDPKVTKRTSQDDRFHRSRQNSRPRALTGHCAPFLFFYNYQNSAFVLKMSAEKLRVKTDKTMVGCVVAGALLILPEAVALSDNRRQKCLAPGFTGFAG
jgi:hypothetical protein